MKFLFIVGAGASCDFGFPTGIELKGLIERKLELIKTTYSNYWFADEKIGSCVQQISHGKPEKMEQLKNASQIITNGLYSQNSIDTFVYAHVNNAPILTMAKMSIYSIIRKYEIDLAARNEKIKKSWFVKFFANFSSHCTFEEFKVRIKEVGFIVFNYDMCLEYCMAKMISDRFAVEEKIANELVSQMKIIHPYGSTRVINHYQAQYNYIGNLGLGVDHHSIIESMDNIYTFSEGAENPSNIKEMRDMLVCAEKMVLLGYGFVPINKELMLSCFPEGNVKLPNLRMVLGTSFGISDNDINDIKEDWLDSFGISGSWQFEKVQCSELFQNNTRALMF